MTRERAKSMDQTSFWTLGMAEAPGKLGRPLTVYSEPGRMLAFAQFQGFIWGMSTKYRTMIRRRIHGTIVRWS